MPRAAILMALLALSLLSCRARQAAEEAALEPAQAEEDAGARKKGPVRIVYPAAPGSFVDLMADLEGAVVSLRSTSRVAGGPAATLPGSEDRFLLGSGILVDNAGHVLTNDHVIANAAEILVMLSDGREFGARVVGRDPKLDIGLIVLEGASGLKPARLGNSDDVRIGEWVVALGNPTGREVMASAGVLSGRGAGGEASLSSARKSAYQSFLRTDATIIPENSGGPLVTTAGEVIGISTAVDAGKSQLGYAIPIIRAAEVLPLLKKEGRVSRTWLGVYVHPVDSKAAARLGLDKPSGALVSEVIAGAPAATAGIAAGDVILSFDGKPVDHKNLPWIASRAGAGRTVVVVVWRGGAEVEVKLVTEAMPE